MRLLALTCGWLTGPLGSFLAGETGSIRVPIPVFLIDHPRGKVLFDTGLHPATQSDPAGRLGAAARIFSVEFAPGEEIAARLATLEIDAGEITFVVNSHLHFDHTGGNAQLPRAVFLHQRAEWRAGRDPDLIAANYYDPGDYDLGQDVLEIDGEHDLFGDGSVVCVPTPGHTPGHQSLRLRLGPGEVVLTADSCYLRRTLEELHLPAVCHDREAALRSLHVLRDLQARGARLLFGHDPDLWATLPHAPHAIS